MVLVFVAAVVLIACATAVAAVWRRGLGHAAGAPLRRALLATGAVAAPVLALVLGVSWTQAPSGGAAGNLSGAHGSGHLHDATQLAAAPAPGASDDAYWAQVAGEPFHPTGVTRTYYLAAEEVVWDYAPDGRNDVTGKRFDDVADTWVKKDKSRIGSAYVKCLYRQYTDSTFTQPKERPAGDAYLGFTGPVIRAEVGDTIKVHFLNRCSIGASVHPHGVFYQKASEGAPYADNTSGKDTLDDAVPKGGRHTYTWLVPDRAGPGPHDGSSVMWMYHSHTDEVRDTYAGLQGFLVVTARGKARADGSPADVDREVFQLFAVMNEGSSTYLDENIKRFTKVPPAPEDEGFEESNLKHSINGYLFGNQPMVTLRQGERVRWYVMSMGTEVDLHTPHWHGNTVVVMGTRMDVVSLLPASMLVADMVPDNPGIWLFHCHVNDHLTAGMMTRYRVTS
ncbi:hypothetical protein GCM10025782_28100 [Pedococcus ginsenosidimutans]|uniref:Copper oxidase n=1 Tax=Pedococcus ginsenosidimutans TaxID=490570 RepID=A0ABP8YFJ6_9MICO